jgi:ribosomal protein S27AE
MSLPHARPGTCWCSVHQQGMGAFLADLYDRMPAEAVREPSITCPRCGMTSYNENDIREGYCGNCHDWTGVPGL